MFSVNATNQNVANFSFVYVHMLSKTHTTRRDRKMDL